MNQLYSIYKIPHLLQSLEMTGVIKKTFVTMRVRFKARLTIYQLFGVE